MREFVAKLATDVKGILCSEVPIPISKRRSSTEVT
jgi:hypothetical protein